VTIVIIYRYINSERAEDQKVNVHRGIGAFEFKTPSASVIESIKSMRLTQYLGNKQEAGDRRTSDIQGLLGVSNDDDEIEMNHLVESSKIIV
jgi:hypothetical protein